MQTEFSHLSPGCLVNHLTPWLPCQPRFSILPCYLVNHLSPASLVSHLSCWLPGQPPFTLAPDLDVLSTILTLSTLLLLCQPLSPWCCCFTFHPDLVSCQPPFTLVALSTTFHWLPCQPPFTLVV